MRPLVNLGLFLLSYSLAACSMPSPEDYVKPGRKWLTFKNISDGKALQVDSLLEFDELMQQRGKLCVILFYDDRTTHSKQILPLWEALAITLNGVAKVCAISVSHSFGAFLANMYGVKTTPSVHIISQPTSADPQYTTDMQSLGVHVVEWTDGLSVEAINKAVMKLLGDQFIAFPKTQAELDRHLPAMRERSGKYAVVLLTRKKQTTDLFKTLSYKYASEFTFLQIPYSTDLAPPLMEKFRLEKPSDWGPLVFLWDIETADVILKYEGKKFDIASLSAFLEQYVPEASEVAQKEAADLETLIAATHSRCQSVSFAKEEDVREAISSDDSIIVLLSSANEKERLSFAQRMACAYTTRSTVKKVLCMRSEHAAKLKANLDIASDDALIAVSPQMGLYSVATDATTLEDFIRFGQAPFSDPKEYSDKLF